MGTEKVTLHEEECVICEKGHELVSNTYAIVELSIEEYSEYM